MKSARGTLLRASLRVGTVHVVQQDHQIRQGYLLLADISGYTAFLTGTELDHAHAIIQELTSLIRERLAPPMRFVKLEGDAVFCYADQSTFRDGERFIELVEACYFDFSNRLADMTRSTTCPCNACAAIGSLGLKFIGHHGSYVIEREGDREDLAGPDVILIHRLLKNSISDGDGPQAYAFFTDTCLSQMSSSLALPTHREVYDSFGETTGGVHDLGPALDAMRAARHEFIAAEDADVEMSVELPVPPAAAWQYNVDPVERQRWVCTRFSKDPDEVTPNEQGRLGAGAAAHCNHGPGTGIREYVDWRPFAYFTCRTTVPPRVARLVGFQRQIETYEFVPIGEHGTRMVVRFRLMDRRRRSLLRLRAFRPIYAAMFRSWSAALLAIAKEDTAAHGQTEGGA
jgi:hypothetical protein